METFFLPSPSPDEASRASKRNETKLPHARSLACIDGYFPLLFVSINRVLSSVAAVHDNPAVPRRLALPSSPSIPTADLPMEARSRDKLGQPIEELNPAVSERRDRAARFSRLASPLLSPPRPLLSSGGGAEEQSETGERWKNSHAERRGVAGRGSGRKEGRSNRAPPARKLIDTIN